jgi:GNAT superfamily N-acetyltransferase
MQHRQNNEHSSFMPDHSFSFFIRSVGVEQVLALRRAVLLNGDANASHFRGDDRESTLHLAVYEGNEIVAVSTICEESAPDSGGDAAWRLRGVAVEPRLQGYGFGRVLVKLCIEHARRHRAERVWCTARESAKRFYDALGFVSSRPPFTLPVRIDIQFYEMHYLLPAEAAGNSPSRREP